MIDSYVRIFSLHMYAYVSASYDDCFVKIWATCENFLGKWFTALPWQIIARTPMAETQDGCSKRKNNFKVPLSILYSRVN